jgi:acetyltransferase EpsM
MYLYGASGHAKVVIELLEAAGIKVAGLFDDNASLDHLWEYPVSRMPATVEAPMIITIGNNTIRKKIADTYGVEYGKVAHPRAVISPRAHIHVGTVIMGGVTINADTIIGHHCIINTNASVDHDCVIGDFVHISPNVALCGGITVGEGTHIGAGAVVKPGVKIGKWVTVGAGTVVLKDIPDGKTVVGNPGKIIK